MSDLKQGDKFLLPAMMVEGGWVSIGGVGGNQTQFKNNMIDIDQLAVPANLLTDLEAENARLRSALEDAKYFIQSYHRLTGICCCGESVESHDPYHGHEPVDSGFYRAQSVTSKIEAALNTGDDQ